MVRRGARTPVPEAEKVPASFVVTPKGAMVAPRMGAAFCVATTVPESVQPDEDGTDDGPVGPMGACRGRLSLQPTSRTTRSSTLRIKVECTTARAALS